MSTATSAAAATTDGWTEYLIATFKPQVFFFASFWCFFAFYFAIGVSARFVARMMYVPRGLPFDQPFAPHLESSGKLVSFVAVSFTLFFSLNGRTHGAVRCLARAVTAPLLRTRRRKTPRSRRRATCAAPTSRHG